MPSAWRDFRDGSSSSCFPTRVMTKINSTNAVAEWKWRSNIVGTEFFKRELRR